VDAAEDFIVTRRAIERHTHQQLRSGGGDGYSTFVWIFIHEK
jgi:hypothetical protein